MKLLYTENELVQFLDAWLNMPKRFADIKPRPRLRNIIVVLSMTADNAACEAIRSKVIVFYDF